MKEITDRIVMAVVMALLGSLGGCLGTGCMRITKIGVPGNPPVLELKLSGADLIIRWPAVEFAEEGPPAPEAETDGG
jgi:hypothetical protein